MSSSSSFLLREYYSVSFIVLEISVIWDWIPEDTPRSGTLAGATYTFLITDQSEPLIDMRLKYSWRV